LPDVARSDRIIAQGAAWLAHDNRRLRLAKAFEVLHADNSYVSIVSEQTPLPRENGRVHVPFSMYCVDPRDGFAKFQFARPRLPGRAAPSDPRSSYATLTLRVDHKAKPMFERLEVEVEIDHDLVARVGVRSSLVDDKQTVEIHDLEFGLGLDEVTPASASGPTGGGRANEAGDKGVRRHSSFGVTAPGAVRLRSNITDSSNAWHLVPGEIVDRYRAGYMDRRNRPPEFQVEEKLYYTPCALCGRKHHLIHQEGCISCGISPSPVEGRAIP